MNKYVIELRPDCKVVQEICESDGKVSIGAKSINYLEELNSDYINEHFGDLQDTAYQEGFKDGKADKGCEGCRYEHYKAEICQTCMNNYVNHWESAKQDDKIVVGDEVKWNSDLIVIAKVYTDGGFDWCDGIGEDGRAFHILKENARKTGRHFDIQSILEAMKA